LASLFLFTNLNCDFICGAGATTAKEVGSFCGGAARNCGGSGSYSFCSDFINVVFTFKKLRTQINLVEIRETQNLIF
jgi:hypothetical protein